MRFDFRRLFMVLSLCAPAVLVWQAMAEDATQPLDQAASPGTPADDQAENPLNFPHLDKMSSTIQGCRRQILEGRFSEALQRLDAIKDKKLSDEERAATLKLIDFAYEHGLNPQVKAIEDADPLMGLRLLNLFKPPGDKPGPYAPRLKERIAVLEAKLRSPEAKQMQDIGRAFEQLFLQYQAFPDENKARLEEFVAAHANDAYGPMAQRVLEGKEPTELDVDGIATGLQDVASASAAIAYPSDMGAFKCDVPKNGAEFKKACIDFLKLSEAALKKDTADCPDCTPAFWNWLDRHPEIRTGLLLAKNPVPAQFAANLAAFHRKFGEKTCNRYGQLVLASSLTEQDVSVNYGAMPYKPEDLSENQRKVGAYLIKNNIPFWVFLKDKSGYAERAGASSDDVGDIGKMAYVSHTYPPRVTRSRMEYLRAVIRQQESRLSNVAWPVFPVVTTPYILQNPVAAANNLSQREHAFVWDKYSGGQGMIGYGKYGFEYELPEVKYKKSLWEPNTVVRIIEDGGVCGRMATACVIGEVLLGIPATTAGQPGHCALMEVGFDGKRYNASIGQSVTGTWMNTGPGMLGVSPAIHGLEGTAVSWLALTQTVNRVGMVNYHASLVAGYMADATGDAEAQRRWLDLAIRVNPYHLAAIEKRWGIASDQGANALNKTMQETIMRMAVKPGKGFDDTVLGTEETNIIRKLVGRNLAPMYDKIMIRDGNGDPGPYKIAGTPVDEKVGTPGGAEYKGTDERAVNKDAAKPVALAVTAGPDDKLEVKQDLDLMHRYMVAFAKKGLLYGFTMEVFLKHISKVDPDIAMKMLNDMLAETLKLPPDLETNDEADSPLFVVTKAIGEMSLKLSPQARSNGLHTLCGKIAAGSPRFYKKYNPELVNKKTIFPPEMRPNKAYMMAFEYLQKDLRLSGPKGIELADKAELNMARELAVATYECKKERYKLILDGTGSPPPDGVPKPPDLKKYIYHPKDETPKDDTKKAKAK